MAVYDVSMTYFLLGSGVLTTLSVVFFTIHLVQTLYFEGKYSEKNLELINGDSEKLASSENNISAFWYYALLFSKNGLWTQSVLHAGEDALPVVMIMKSFGLNNAAYFTGFVVALISYTGTQRSEVWSAGINTETELANYQHT